jgi:hypothetical protein
MAAAGTGTGAARGGGRPVTAGPGGDGRAPGAGGGGEPARRRRPSGIVRVGSMGTGPRRVGGEVVIEGGAGEGALEGASEGALEAALEGTSEAGFGEEGSKGALRVDVVGGAARAAAVADDERATCAGMGAGGCVTSSWEGWPSIAWEGSVSCRAGAGVGRSRASGMIASGGRMGEVSALAGPSAARRSVSGAGEVVRGGESSSLDPEAAWTCGSDCSSTLLDEALLEPEPEPEPSGGSGRSVALVSPHVGQVQSRELVSAVLILLTADPPRPPLSHTTTTHSLANRRRSSLGTSSAPMALSASPSCVQNARSPVMAVRTPHAGCQLPAWKLVRPSMQIWNQLHLGSEVPSCPARSARSG